MIQEHNTEHHITTIEEALDESSTAQVEWELEVQKKLTKIDALIAQKKSELTDAKTKVKKIMNSEGFTDEQKEESAKVYKESINELQHEIAELANNKKFIQSPPENGRDIDIKRAVQKLRDFLQSTQHNSAYIVHEDRFIHIANESKDDSFANITMREYTPTTFVNIISNMIDEPAYNLPIPLVKEAYRTTGWQFKFKSASVYPQRWNERIFNPLNILERYFCRIDRTEQYSPLFDVLMNSLCGGKKENIEHIEKWTAHRRVNWRNALTTPGLVQIGYVGGNGKQIFAKILRQMFTGGSTVALATAKQLTGGFNGIMEMKLVVILDDQQKDSLPKDLLKQLAQNDQMIIESKGRDAYEAEKCGVELITTNGVPFQLDSGGGTGGVDRRWSFTTTNITFIESMKQYLYDQGRNVTDEELIEEVKKAAELLGNRVEIEKWISHNVRKYSIDNNFVLKPLHGNDYSEILASQQTTFERMFAEFILPLIKSGKVIPFFVIKQMIIAIDGTKHQYSDKGIHNMIREQFDKTSVKWTSLKKRINIIDNNKTVKKEVRCVASIDCTDFDFDWTQVCNEPFKELVGITADNVISGSVIVDDEEEEDFTNNSIINIIKDNEIKQTKYKTTSEKLAEMRNNILNSPDLKEII